MRQQHTINPDHPDLARAGLNRLSKEIEYVRTQYLRAKLALDEAMHAIYKGEQPQYPIWMYQDDLNFHIERLRAVAEEIEYRAEMMR